MRESWNIIFGISNEEGRVPGRLGKKRIEEKGLFITDRDRGTRNGT